MRNRLIELADHPGSAMRRQSEKWDGNVNRFLDNAQGTIPLGAFVRPTNLTPGEVEALNQDLVFLFEVVDIGGVLTVGELATGRKLSFTLLGQRDLSTSEKVALVGELAAPYVVVFVAKGGKWMLKSVQKADSVADAVHIVDNMGPKGDEYSFALGLTRHPDHTRSGLLMRFADKVDDTNVRHYWQLIDEMGLPNAPVGRQLEKQLLDFMSNSKHIHFNLDGVVDTLDAAKLKQILKRGEQGTRVRQNITRWEFLQVWTKYRQKATFYFDGKPVDLTDLLK